MSLNPTQTKETATAFISYAREEKEFVLRLCESLKAHGVEPVGDWLLISGENYEDRLRKLNLSSQAFVFVITPDSIKSKACLNELALAVENKKQVLPVSRRDHGDDYEAGVRELVKAIHTDFDLMETHGRLLLAAEEWKDNGRNRRLVAKPLQEILRAGAGALRTHLRRRRPRAGRKVPRLPRAA